MSDESKRFWPRSVIELARTRTFVGRNGRRTGVIIGTRRCHVLAARGGYIDEYTRWRVEIRVGRLRLAAWTSE